LYKGNLKSEKSQDYAQKPRRNCTFMNSASGDCGELQEIDGIIGIASTSLCDKWLAE
jgi:hypothetical protein